MIDRIAARAGELYSLPAVAMEVLDLTDRPEVDTAALKACIENDPALTGKILRVVNSSLFGLSRAVGDLSQALALLGIKPLKLLVLGFSLPPDLFQGLTQQTLSYYWRHALTKAVAARELCERFWKRPGDEAFIAGLLQDLGMLVLIQQLGDAYGCFLEKVVARGDDLLDRETQSMGFNHAQLTARLLSQWGLPGTLAESVAVPAALDELSAPARLQAELLSLAETIAQFLADGKPSALHKLTEMAEASGRLDPAALEEFLPSLDEKIAQLADVFSVRMDDTPSTQELLARAHQQLAVVAASAAEELVQQSEQPAETETVEEDEHSELSAMMDAYLTDDAAAISAHRTRTRSAGVRSAPPPPQPATGRHTNRTALAAPPAPSFTPEPNDPGLVGQLTAAVMTCRQQHWALSLALLRYHSPDDLTLQFGVESLPKLVGVLDLACRKLEHHQAVTFPYGDAGCAFILPDCERKTAVEYGHYLVDTIRSLRVSNTPLSGGVLALDVGIASVDAPSRNFDPQSLVDAASRCLFASHTSGGAVVKSIEIY